MKKIILLLLVATGTTGYITYQYLAKNSLTPSDFSKTLIVGTCDDYPPYSFNDNGKIVGFDIDVIHEVSRRMSVPLELKNMSFDILLLELQRGTVHVVAAGLTATPNRAEKVLFTKPYLEADPLLAVVVSGNNALPLEGKRIIVNEGYTADQYLSGKPNLTLARVESVPEALLALSQNKADVFVIAQSAFQPVLKNKKNTDFSYTVLEGIEENCALAVSKKYAEIHTKIEDALQELSEDGTIEDLKKKWGL